MSPIYIETPGSLLFQSTSTMIANPERRWDRRAGWLWRMMPPSSISLSLIWSRPRYNYRHGPQKSRGVKYFRNGTKATDTIKNAHWERRISSSDDTEVHQTRSSRYLHDSDLFTRVSGGQRIVRLNIACIMLRPRLGSPGSEAWLAEMESSIANSLAARREEDRAGINFYSASAKLGNDITAPTIIDTTISGVNQAPAKQTSRQHTKCVSVSRMGSSVSRLFHAWQSLEQPGSLAWSLHREKYVTIVYKPIVGSEFLRYAQWVNISGKKEGPTADWSTNFFLHAATNEIFRWKAQMGSAISTPTSVTRLSTLIRIAVPSISMPLERLDAECQNRPLLDLSSISGRRALLSSSMIIEINF